ncbi:hypothetical protein B0H13DRAFT_2667858 [Mycena leptocephala]|nr:hypothetical protein B0H13DRAFT_2667858 [Mycena leptocephala]
MLQIPSSVLSLFSFSSKGLVGLLGGFCIGAQLTVSIVLSGLSVPKITDSLNLATRTTEIVLVPTKCALSNGTISFPYVAAMGYATIIFAGFFYILRAKGFSCSLSTFPPIQNPPDGHPPNAEEPIPIGFITPPRSFSLSHSHNVVNTQPPSPPPEPSSLCTTGKAPRRNRWIWLLLLLLSLVVMLLVGIYVYFYFTCPDSPATLDAFTPFGSRLSRRPNLLLQGVYCSRGVYFDCQLLHFDSQHLHLFVCTYISSYGWQYSKLLLISITSHFVCIRIVKALKRRVYAPSWEFVTDHEDSQPIVVTVHKSLLWLWRHVQFSFPLTPSLDEIPMIVGPIMIHTHLFFVWLTYIVLIVFLVIARTLIPKFLTPSRLKYLLRRCIFNIAFFGSYVLILFSIVEYSFQSPDVKEILWKAFSCRQSRDSLASNILMATFESWNAMCLMRKVLIVAPAVVHYGYYDIIPAAKKLSALIRKWRRRWYISFFRSSPARLGLRIDERFTVRRRADGQEKWSRRRSQQTTHRKFPIKNDGHARRCRCGHEDCRGRLIFLTSSISRFPEMVFCLRHRWLCLGCRCQGPASTFRPPSLRLYPQPYALSMAH